MNSNSCCCCCKPKEKINSNYPELRLDELMSDPDVNI